MREEAIIRRAAPADAAAIGPLHVACLHETYTDLMPSDWLAVRTVEERTSLWGRVLNDPVASNTIAVCIAECEGAICGFGSCGWQRADSLTQLGFPGEFSAIYVLQRFQRRGIGRALMRGLTSALVESRIGAAALWCLKDNDRARRFYEALGGEFVLEQVGPEFHAGQIEVVYGWRDMAQLMSRCEYPEA
jgi:ribosomal protein S18 acetylase RimI-like enzyme